MNETKPESRFEAEPTESQTATGDRSAAETTQKPRKTGHGHKPRVSLGRPKADTVRDHYITVRVTAAEHFKALDKANRAGQSLTDFCRGRILRGIARKRKVGNTAEEVWIDEATPLLQAVMRSWHELHKMAVNLNQIARHCNTHMVPPGPLFQQLQAELLQLLRSLTRP